MLPVARLPRLTKKPSPTMTTPLPLFFLLSLAEKRPDQG